MKTDTRTDSISKILYANSVGVIFEEAILLYNHNGQNPIYLENIRKVKVEKHTLFFVDLLYVAISTFFLFVVWRFNFTVREIILSILLYLTLLLASTKIIRSKYTMIFVMSNACFIELTISGHLKNDAKKIAGKLNRILKRKSFVKVSGF